MRIRRTGVILAVGLLASLASVLVAGQKNDQAEVQLKAAMHRELVDGDLKGAIGQYEKILAAFGSNRIVVAQALVQMGQCYEKLGQKEARSAYERVVREFADQSEPARLARQRLAALQAPAAAAARSETVVRRVWTKRGTVASFAGAPSPDGRYLPYYEGESGDLAIHDFATGRSRRLNLKKGDWKTSDEEASDPVLSPDGKRIAYSYLTNDSSHEVRVVGLDGSEPHVLYTDKEVQPSPHAWSPDGTKVLCTLQKKDDTRDLALISVADGLVKPLKTLTKNTYVTPGFSPDGRFVVYDLPQAATGSQRDIFTLEIETGRETLLVQHASNDRLLGWTPDNTGILFSSDRSGRRDAWLIRVSDGQPQGMPEEVKRDLGSGAPLGFTRTGAYYYRIPGYSRAIHAAALDIASGKLLEPLRPAPRGVLGFNYTPAWSADGKFLAFASRRSPGEHVIVIQSAQTGEERELKLKNVAIYSSLSWAPDGRHLLTDVRDAKNAGGLVQVDVQTGDTLAVVQFPSLGLSSFGYLRDGKRIFCTSWDPKRQFVLLIHDLETGQDTELARGAIYYPTLSPDGKWLAFSAYVEATRSYVVTLIPAAGGPLRELHSFPASGPRGMAWTPDGRHLLCGFVNDWKSELWRVAVADGRPQRLDVDVFGMWQFSLHPDGRQIAFEAWENKEEVWVMENFLPPLKAAR